MPTDRVAFVLVPGFSLLALSAGVEPLRVANAVRGERLFEWVLVSETPGPVVSSSHVPMHAEPLSAAVDTTIVAVCGGNRSHLGDAPLLKPWLRAAGRRGAMVGAFSDASYLVAAAGLYEDVPSTIHWHCLDSYRERFPWLDIRATLFELHERRFSSAGGTASLDLMLTLLQIRHGSDLATAVASTFIHEQIRAAGSGQLSGYFLLQHHSRQLAEAVRLMEHHVETPLPVAEIAERVGASPRQLDRLFQRHLQVSPSHYYRRLRVDRARHLLVQTSLPVVEIAAATGFCSSAHLARCFRDYHRVSPLDYRQSLSAQQPAVSAVSG